MKPEKPSDIDILETRGLVRASSHIRKAAKKLKNKRQPFHLGHIKHAHRTLYEESPSKNMGGIYRSPKISTDNFLERIDGSRLNFPHWTKISERIAILDSNLRHLTSNLKSSVKTEKELDFLVNQVDTQNNCPCCKNKLKAFCTLVGRGGQQKMRLGLCESCGYVGYIDRPSKYWIVKFYDEEWDNAKARDIKYEAARLKSGLTIQQQEVVRLAENSGISKNRPVADIGCGNGGILKEFENRGFKNLFGVENYAYRAELASVYSMILIPPDSPAAFSQNWHRDSDDKKIIKVFIYITDVNEVGDGPFMYVKGSQCGGRWRDIFPQVPPVGSYPSRGSVEKIVTKEDIQTCLGKAGTIIFCDTSGLHKGGYCVKSRRIMSAATFVSSASAYKPNFDIAKDADIDHISSISRYALNIDE